VHLPTLNIHTTGLPELSLPYINQMKKSKISGNLEETLPDSQASGSEAKKPTPESSPSKSRRLRKDSLENLDDDPWASPALHKNHTHTVNNDATPPSTSTAAKPLRNGLSEPSRTTSAFTTHTQDPTSTSPSMATDPPADGSGGGWGSDGPPNNSFTGAEQPGLSGGGFADGQGSHTGENAGRSLGGGRTYNRGAEETVIITLLPEKEGMFMFQHHNYEVKCARKASSVIRRYSDFVWLLDCLHKRYPFRQLPLLPPKRVAGKRHNLYWLPRD